MGLRCDTRVEAIRTGPLGACRTPSARHARGDEVVRMIDEVEVGLRRIVADEIGDYLSRAASDGRRVPDELDQRQMARAILRRELDERAKTS